MLCIKTYLSPSEIEGLGVFAAEYIHAGSLVWTFAAGIDVLFEQEQVHTLSLAAQEYLNKYAYLDCRVRKYVICGDDARFINHSSSPNLIGIYPQSNPYGIDVALRDIQVGEELTSDYSSFDINFLSKLDLNFC
jgi:SET domain-containing protein